MKYFAKLGLNGSVLSVNLLEDIVAPTEQVGIDYLTETTNWPIWKQTFKDRSQRKNYAGINYKYDEERDAFIPPKPPYVSWALNEETCQYEAPVIKPLDQPTIWNEETQQWDLLDE